MERLLNFKEVFNSIQYSTQRNHNIIMPVGYRVLILFEYHVEYVF